MTTHESVFGIRIGQGVDMHRLVPGGPLHLGGVVIPHDLHLDGHSDADVVAHAIADALLSAAGHGDLGTLLPADDPLRRASAARRYCRGWPRFWPFAAPGW